MWVGDIRTSVSPVSSWRLAPRKCLKNRCSYTSSSHFASVGIPRLRFSFPVRFCLSVFFVDRSKIRASDPRSFLLLGRRSRDSRSRDPSKIDDVSDSVFLPVSRTKKSPENPPGFVVTVPQYFFFLLKKLDGKNNFNMCCRFISFCCTLLRVAKARYINRSNVSFTRQLSSFYSMIIVSTTIFKIL